MGCSCSTGVAEDVKYMDEPKQATKSAEPETIEDKTKRTAPSIAPSDTTAPVVATSIMDQAAGPTQDNFHTYTASTDTCETVKAAVELITKLKAQIPANETLKFFSVQADGEVPNTEAFIEEIKKQVPGVPFFGSSSGGGAVTWKGLFKASVMGFTSPDTQIGTEVLGFSEDHKDVEAQVTAACMSAVEQAGVKKASRWDGENKQEKIKGNYAVFFHQTQPGFTGLNERILEQVQLTLGRRTRLIGALACPDPDQTYADNVRVYGDKGCNANGISVGLVLLPKSVKAVTSIEPLFEPTPTCTGIVTGVKDLRLITSIDNRPALEVLNEWTGNIFAGAAQTAKDTNENAWVGWQCSMYPMAKIIQSDDGKKFGFSLVTTLFITPKEELLVTGNMAEGDKVLHFHAKNESRIIDKMSLIGSFPRNRILACLGTMCITGLVPCSQENRIKPFIENYTFKMGKVPFVIHSAFGESGNTDIGPVVTSGSLSECLFVSTDTKSTVGHNNLSSQSTSSGPVTLSSLPPVGEGVNQGRYFSRYVLNSKHRSRFYDVAKKLYCQEMVDFWDGVEEYREWKNSIEVHGLELKSIMTFKAEFDRLFKKFVDPQSATCINIPGKWVRKLKELHQQQYLGVDEINLIFQAQLELENLMDNNIVRTFKKDFPDEYAEVHQLQKADQDVIVEAPEEA